MRLRNGLLAFSVLTILAPLKFMSPAVAVEDHDCSQAPAGAVTALPMPLAKWGQIACTPIGQVLMSQDNWLWIMPDASGLVFIPSQMIDGEPQDVGNKAYFTKVDIHQVKGHDFDDAYNVFHTGFDEKEVKPDAYQVDLTAVSGKTIRIFVFDYDSYAWGMTCPDSKCDPDTRFMILNKDKRPEPRQPAI